MLENMQRMMLLMSAQNGGGGSVPMNITSAMASTPGPSPQLVSNRSFTNMSGIMSPPNVMRPVVSPPTLEAMALDRLDAQSAALASPKTKAFDEFMQNFMNNFGAGASGSMSASQSGSYDGLMRQLSNSAGSAGAGSPKRSQLLGLGYKKKRESLNLSQSFSFEEDEGCDASDSEKDETKKECRVASV